MGAKSELVEKIALMTEEEFEEFIFLVETILCQRAS